jgi:PPOX class probable F420-dependent enzyme
LDRRLIAALATLDEAQSIHVVPMWFRLDGDHLLIPTSGKTRKVRNLRRNPSATVMVDDSRGGLSVRAVVLAGSARIVEGPEARSLNRSIHVRYVTDEGLDLPEVRAHLQADDVTIHLVPERVRVWDRTAAPASRLLVAGGFALPLDR